jgi:hypothetical protein
MKPRIFTSYAFILAAAIVAGLSQPFVDRAAVKADPVATGAALRAASGAGQVRGTTATVGNTHVGTDDDDEGYPPDKYPGYGPVDQSAPLNFQGQPASVPRNYVPGRLYNVQVLRGKSYAQIVGQMAAYTQALGVSCTYCHNAANFAYDTPTKRIARTMQAMVIGLDSNWVSPIHKQYTNFAVTGQVGCVTCHRGQPRMHVAWNIVPVQYLDWPAKTTKQAGYVVNSMYSVSKSLGVNCLFCHNSADFISLQYYPTNQIAHRMWAMVDAINHTYLPANIKAVTCFTCHHGAKWPSELVTAGNDQTPVDALPLHPEVHENPGSYLASGVR